MVDASGPCLPLTPMRISGDSAHSAQPTAPRYQSVNTSSSHSTSSDACVSTGSAVQVRWQPFVDAESPVVRYEVKLIEKDAYLLDSNSSSTTMMHPWTDVQLGLAHTFPAPPLQENCTYVVIVRVRQTDKQARERESNQSREPTASVSSHSLSLSITYPLPRLRTQLVVRVS